jgi:Arc/MetJ-type ribon-helix-helix transcriptional regulator
MSEPTVRATVTLPTSVVASADALVKAGRVRSRSDLVVRALRRELEAMQREQLDAQFAGMAADEEFQREAQTIAAEFSASDWEALPDEEQGP